MNGWQAVEFVVRLVFVASLSFLVLSVPAYFTNRTGRTHRLSFKEILGRHPDAGLWWLLDKFRFEAGLVCVSSGLLALLALLAQWPGL